MKVEFIKKHLSAALAIEKEKGIPALFALAQSALESGWGKHAPGNMMFGFKVGSGKNYGGWTGMKQLLTTTEYSSKSDLKFPEILPGYPQKHSSGKWRYRVKDYFRAYPSSLEAFRDWAGLLTGASRYKKAFLVADNPGKFAEAIAAAGYATAPTYADKVKTVMKEVQGLIDLHQLTPASFDPKWLVLVACLPTLAAVMYFGGKQVKL